METVNRHKNINHNNKYYKFRYDVHKFQGVTSHLKPQTWEVQDPKINYIQGTPQNQNICINEQMPLKHIIISLFAGIISTMFDASIE